MSDALYIRQGKGAALNITAATVVATVTADQARGQGRLVRVQVIVAGSAAGAAYDSASTTGNSAANQLTVIPNVVGNYLVDMPYNAGLVIAPGTGQTVAVSYD